MFKSPKSIIALTFAASCATGLVHPKDYHVGTPATAVEIAGWDIDIRPDGKGLPIGSGNAIDGEAAYEMVCASCHGVFGEGEGRWPV